MAMSTVDGVTFEELERSPMIWISQGAARATRVFRVPDWSQWQAFVRVLVGRWTAVGVSPVFVAPLAFPGYPTMLVDEVQIEPFDAMSPDGTVPVDLATTTNTYAQGARVTVQYKTLPQDGGGTGSDPDRPDGTTLVVQVNGGTELSSIPGRAWRWNTAGAPAVDPDQFTGILIPTADYNLTWGRVPIPPWETMRTMRGKVNSLPFLGAPAGTLLFAGYQARRLFQFLEDGGFWEFDYVFREQANYNAAGTQVRGWNYFYREQASGGEHYLKIVNEDGDPPYKEADFQDLFKFPVVTP